MQCKASNVDPSTDLASLKVFHIKKYSEDTRDTNVAIRTGIRVFGQDEGVLNAHVRLIENTDARVVVHWRYASIDVGYLFPSPRHWTG